MLGVQNSVGQTGSFYLPGYHNSLVAVADSWPINWGSGVRTIGFGASRDFVRVSSAAEKPDQQDATPSPRHRAAANTGRGSPRLDGALCCKLSHTGLKYRGAGLDSVVRKFPIPVKNLDLSSATRPFHPSREVPERPAHYAPVLNVKVSFDVQRTCLLSRVSRSFPMDHELLPHSTGPPSVQRLTATAPSPSAPHSSPHSTNDVRHGCMNLHSTWSWAPGTVKHAYPGNSRVPD